MRLFIAILQNVYVIIWCVMIYPPVLLTPVLRSMFWDAVLDEIFRETLQVENILLISFSHVYDLLVASKIMMNSFTVYWYYNCRNKPEPTFWTACHSNISSCCSLVCRGSLLSIQYCSQILCLGWIFTLTTKHFSWNSCWRGHHEHVQRHCYTRVGGVWLQLRPTLTQDRKG